MCAYRMDIVCATLLSDERVGDHFRDDRDHRFRSKKFPIKAMGHENLVQHLRRVHTRRRNNVQASWTRIPRRIERPKTVGDSK